MVNRIVKTIMLAAAFTWGLGIQNASHAALTFTFNYNTPFTGFEDPTLGSARQAALDSAASLLGSYFTAYDANLTFDVFSENINNGSLAAAGSGSLVIPGTFQNTVVQEKILTNGATDLNGASADGDIFWNFFETWDLDDNIAASAFDFKSTAMHELLHAFGFSSVLGPNGDGIAGVAMPGTDPDAWLKFDNFLTDGSGNRLIGTDGVFDLAQLPDVTGGTGVNGVFFNGANAMAANGGNAVNLFSPSTYSFGSSIAHLDDDFYTSQALLMEAMTGTGQGIRTLSAIELGILQDIGYTQVSAIPVPPAIVLMGSGLVALFGMARRRRNLEAV